MLARSLHNSDSSQLAWAQEQESVLASRNVPDTLAIYRHPAQREGKETDLAFHAGVLFTIDQVHPVLHDKSRGRLSSELHESEPV